MKENRRKIVNIALIGCFAVFLGVSLIVGFTPGRCVGETFASTLGDMMKLLPCAFVLIALFDVWVKREMVERHFGSGSGIRGYLWGILLAGTTIGGLYLAFPLAYSLHRKGAKLNVIFAYIGFSGVCRIPMTMFEASFMGLKFTAVRLAVSLPLIILFSVLMGRILTRRGYEIME